jgi:two-component system, OmpR family, response regulator
MPKADRMHSMPPTNTPVRIASNQQRPVLRVGSLEIDITHRAARRGDRSFELLPREFRLLEYRMRRQNQILTRAMLFQEVWNYNFVPETNLVDVHMGKLRRKVDAPNEAQMIRNIRGEGFILNATSGAAVPQGGAA